MGGENKEPLLVVREGSGGDGYVHVYVHVHVWRGGLIGDGNKEGGESREGGSSVSLFFPLAVLAALFVYIELMLAE